MKCQIHIQVIPKSARTELVSWESGILKVRVKAVPEKGKANKELIEFLAKWLKIPKTAIELIKGEASRHKTFSLPITQDALLQAIEAQLS